jgi:hypothetical protein
VLDWLVSCWQWPAAALVAAVALLATLPAFAGVAGLALALVYVQIPAYLLHQFEEHHGDRFRVEFNRLVGDGREILTPLAVFVINSVGVWAVDLISLTLAVFVSEGYGLIAAMMALVNAAIHSLSAVLTRRTNPGLVSALVLFLPLGGWCVAVLSERATRAELVIGMAVPVVLHLGIIGYALTRKRQLTNFTGEITK